MPEQTRSLLVNALDGDESAKGQLLERVRARLELWITTRLSPRLRSKVEAEDVVQETLLAVHKGLDGFEGDDKAFLRWIFTIAENRIRDLADHFGAQKRKTLVPVDRDQTTPSEGAAREEMAARVREALGRLDETHRQVVQLRRFEELEVPEIAKIMDRSENAVRIVYCRAIRALRDEMAKAQ